MYRQMNYSAVDRGYAPSVQLHEEKDIFLGDIGILRNFAAKSPDCVSSDLCK